MMRRKRSGYSLVELIVVMTVLSVVWLSVTRVLYVLYRADHRLRDNLQSERAIDLLATRLRMDAHAATSAMLRETNEDGTELVLSARGGNTIHFGLSEAGFSRVVRNGDVVLHQDAFLVGPAKSKWELSPADAPVLIALVMTTADRQSEASRVRRIKAAVGSANEQLARSQELSP